MLILPSLMVLEAVKRETVSELRLHKFTFLITKRLFLFVLFISHAQKNLPKHYNHVFFSKTYGPIIIVLSTLSINPRYVNFVCLHSV